MGLRARVIFLISWTLIVSVASGQHTIPDLPAGLSLKELTTEADITFHYLSDGRVARVSATNRRTSSIDRVVGLLMRATPTCLDTAALGPNTQKAREFLHQCASRDDIIEAILKANHSEHVYPCAQMVAKIEAAGGCDPARLASWKLQFAD